MLEISCLDNNDDETIVATEEPIEEPQETIDETLTQIIDQYIQYTYEIDSYIEEPMIGLGSKIVEWGKLENIDPRLAVAIGRKESGLAANPTPCQGGSALELFNPWGIGPCNDLYDDDGGWNTSIESVFKNLNKWYLKIDPPLDTVDKISPVYCNSACNDWARDVAQFMRDMCGDPNELTYPISKQDLECEPNVEVQSYTISSNTWSAMFGLTELDILYSIEQDSDGGYIVAGRTNSYSFGESDAWIVKLNSEGEVVDAKNIGTTEFEGLKSIKVVPGGGYIAAGFSDRDGWIVKLDYQLNIEWEIVIGGSEDEELNSIIPTPDGGYVSVGYTSSFGSGSRDGWIVKLNSLGNILWENAYGGEEDDILNSIHLAASGGYVATGYSSSFANGVADGWIFTIDSFGNIERQLIRGKFRANVFNSVSQTSDGGYIVVGSTHSFSESGYGAAWVLKLDATLNVVWERIFGHANDSGETFNAIKQTFDGNYIAAGGVVDSLHGTPSGGWIVKLDTEGNIEWQKGYALTSITNPALIGFTSISETIDRGFVAVGTLQLDENSKVNSWIMKVDELGEISNCGLVTDSSIDGIDFTLELRTPDIVVSDSNSTYFSLSPKAQNSNIDVISFCFEQ